MEVNMPKDLNEATSPQSSVKHPGTPYARQVNVQPGTSQTASASPQKSERSTQVAVVPPQSETATEVSKSDNKTRHPTKVEDLIPPSSDEYAYANKLKQTLIEMYNPAQSSLECWKIFRFKEGQFYRDALFKTCKELGIFGDKEIEKVTMQLNVIRNAVFDGLGLDHRTFRLEHSFINLGDQLFGLSIHDEIGVGASGQVKHCWDSSGNLLAYKSEKSQSDFSMKFIMEDGARSDKAARLAGQLIASGYRYSDTKKSFFDSGKRDSQGGKVLKKISIMNLARGVNLYRFFRKGKLSNVGFFIIFYNIMKSLAVLHEKNILHLDVTSTNFMISDDLSITPVDFELSLILGPGEDFIKSDMFFGSYRAPEVRNSIYSKGTDIYAAAVFLFGGVIQTDQGEQTVSGVVDEKKLSLLLQNIIKLMRDPLFKNRPSAKTVCKIIRQELYNKYRSDPRVQSLLSIPLIEGTQKDEVLTVHPGAPVQASGFTNLIQSPAPIVLSNAINGQSVTVPEVRPEFKGPSCSLGY